MTKIRISMVLAALALVGCGNEAGGFQSVCGTEAAIVQGSAFMGETPTQPLSACSGVLVSPNMMLTAKHCEPMSSNLGWTRFDHPDADLRAYILPEPRLDEPFANIGEAALGEARVEGYGLTQDGTVGLRKGASVYITEIEDTWIITEPGDGNVCSGDSGGPLYIDGEVVGITSVGYGGGESGFEVAGYEDQIDCSGKSGFVNLSGYIDWIESVQSGSELPTTEEMLSGCK